MMSTTLAIMHSVAEFKKKISKNLFNPGQNIWSKVKKSSKIEQN